VDVRIGRTLVAGERPVMPADEAPTVGVEEEFALLDPETGAVAPRAAEVIRDCRDAAGVVAESMTFMVETRTPVCRTLQEVGRSLRSRRRLVADAAREHGVLVAATGLAPFGMPAPPFVTDHPRYRELLRRYPLAMSTAGTCGCHVHVAVPNRQLGAEVLLRLRRWLPALIALSANSPVSAGRDTGWASQRLVLVSRWPTAVPAPMVGSVEEYDDLVAAALSSGDALDARSVYFLARLSPRYPTVEIRVADVCLTVEETLCYVGLVRALVALALRDCLRGRAAPLVPERALRVACRGAVRSGLRGSLADPLTGERIEAWAFVDRLLAHVGPQLLAHGDETGVVSTLGRLRASGGGAERQRRLFAAARSPKGFVAALEATSGWPG
jgi:glutamate---cysteine ligase / carboxylate-amine ligase